MSLRLCKITFSKGNTVIWEQIEENSCKKENIFNILIGRRCLSLVYLQRPCCEHGRWWAGSQWWSRGAWGLVRVNLLPVRWKSQHRMPDMPYFIGFLRQSQWHGDVRSPPGVLCSVPPHLIYLVLSPIAALLVLCLFLSSFILSCVSLFLVFLDSRLLVLSFFFSPLAQSGIRFPSGTWDYEGRKLQSCRLPFFFFFLKDNWMSALPPELFLV